MKLKRKIAAAYIILSVLLIGGFSFSFYRYAERDVIKRAEENLGFLCERTASEINMILQQMESSTIFLLSDVRLLNSIRSIATLDRSEDSNRRIIHESNLAINEALVTYAHIKYFYKINIVSYNGSFFSSEFVHNDQFGGTPDVIENLSWADLADQARGRACFVAPYNDPWDSLNARVFSVVRRIQLKSSAAATYIEVQNRLSVIDDIFSFVQANDIQGLIMTRSGVVYDTGIMNGQIHNHSDAIESRIPLESYNIFVCLRQSLSSALAPLRIIRDSVLLITGILLLFALVYTHAIAGLLTKPLNGLRYVIEHTALENLPEVVDLPVQSDELRQIADAFERMRFRLNEAVDNQIELRVMEQRSLFNALQAQINPHFLYNTLNLISARGAEVGDMEICIICDGMARMFRYATSTQVCDATIREEVEHLQTYMMLMHMRYGADLEYTIEIDPDMFDVRMPKIILQPIVENAMRHAFQNISEGKIVHTEGRIIDGAWQIRVSDNGVGFDEDTLLSLRDKARVIRAQVLGGQRMEGLSIGGMGLVNTYARLLAFYHEDVIFEIGNDVQGGYVIIGRHMEKAEART